MYILATNMALNEEEIVHFKWFLNNKNTYGATNYLYCFTIIMLLCINFFLIGWCIISFSTFYYMLVFVYIGLILISIGITNKITVIDDQLLTRKELLYEFRFLA